MKAMGSLQDDRDRVLNMYKQLEEKHLQVTHRNLIIVAFVEHVSVVSVTVLFCPR